MPEGEDNYLKRIYNLLVGVVVVAALIGIYWFATRNSDASPARQEDDRTQRCQQLLENAYSLERSGQTGDGVMDRTMDGLARNCPSEYAEVVDYVSTKFDETLDDCCVSPVDPSERPWEKYSGELK